MSAKATKGYVRLHGLTVEQQNAIDLLVTGVTDRQAADSVGVHRVTVTKWKTKDPHFQAELNTRRQELWESSVDRLRGLLPAALDALEQELASGKNSGRVAIEIIRLTGLDRGGGKDKPLGAYLIGPTNADSIVDSLARARRPHPLDHLIRDDPVTEQERESILADLKRELAET